MAAKHDPFEHLSPAEYELPAQLEQEWLSPAYVVFLHHVRSNVRRMLELTGSPERWRPHVKTTKLPRVFRELIDQGVRHFKCATVREARHLLETLSAAAVSGDVLVAYPLVGPALAELGRLARRFDEHQVSVLCEDEAPAPDGLGVYVDVNPGMNRTGVPLAQTERILALARAAGSRLRGLHFYDGHLHQADQAQRRQAIFAGHEQLLALVAQLARAGVSIDELITSGTPAFRGALEFEPFATLSNCVHRISPGTVVFHDGRSELEDPRLGLKPAALVYARVISHPTATIATVDAGSKSIAAEAGDPCAFVLGRPGWRALQPSEEHLPLEIASGKLPPRGAGLLLIPRHVCPTTNLAERAVLVENGSLHSIVEVSARGHALVPED